MRLRQNWDLNWSSLQDKGLEDLGMRWLQTCGLEPGGALLRGHHVLGELLESQLGLSQVICVVAEIHKSSKLKNNYNTLSLII